MKLRNQIAQIAFTFHGRWIGQPVERYPNNQQAQQTCRDLNSHSFIALHMCYSPRTISYLREARGGKSLRFV
jgi:hypothetical protein